MSTIVITVVPTELDWLFAGTLQTMRQSMGITLTGLSNASVFRSRALRSSSPGVQRHAPSEETSPLR